jgi:hypothetical protein
VLAFKDPPLASAESININLADGIFLLFLGHYVVARGIQEIIASPQEALGPQPGATD